MRASWEVEGDVDEVAEVVLEGYRDSGEVSLGHADYLDLFGRVWGCVVSSPQGWSEVAIADGRDAVDGKGCTLTVVRLGEVAVREAAAGGEGEP